jgi:hypothetical protein
MVGHVKITGDYQAIEATIAASASVSDVIDIGGHTAFALFMPSAWTAADISFTATHTVGASHNPVVGATGAELSVSATNDVAISLMETVGYALIPFRYIKLVSGTSASPVAQDAERTIYVMVK